MMIFIKSKKKSIKFEKNTFFCLKLFGESMLWLTTKKANTGLVLAFLG